MKMIWYQPVLTNDMIDAVNKNGWEGVPWGSAYMKLTAFPKESEAGATVATACEYGLFKKSYTIETDDIEEAFSITNGFGDPDKLTRHGRTRSGSVGDVVIDGAGKGWLCMSMGWTELPQHVTVMVIKCAHGISADAML